MCSSLNFLLCSTEQKYADTPDLTHLEFLLLRLDSFASFSNSYLLQISLKLAPLLIPLSSLTLPLTYSATVVLRYHELWLFALHPTTSSNLNLLIDN